MRALDAQLSMLRMAKAQGKDVDAQIADTLIAMVKDAYVRGEFEIEYLERTVEAILNGEPLAMVAEGRPEFIIGRNREGE